MTETIPPIEPLLEVAGILWAGGVDFALGGSGLLYALGLVDRVADWDVTTDAPPDMIQRIFTDQEHECLGPSGMHADHKLRLHSGVVEVIVRMALRTATGACRIPTLPAGEWRGVPLGSPEAWAVAYRLMGRAARAEALFDHLRSAGANPEAIGRLLREPLPDDLAARLRGLVAARSG